MAIFDCFTKNHLWLKEFLTTKGYFPATFSEKGKNIYNINGKFNRLYLNNNENIKPYL